MSNWWPPFYAYSYRGADLVIATMLIFAAAVLVVFGGVFLVPIIIVVLIGKGIHWYISRPTPTDQLYAVAEQRAIAANFPNAEQFLDAFLDRLLGAIREEPPALQVYLAMARIADRLYKDEQLNNPLPPLIAPNTIEEGRYRDQLLAQQHKTLDAPRTLELFHRTLGDACLKFINSLPPIAK